MHASRILLSVLLLASPACGAGEDLTAPIGGSLDVAVQTSGSSLDDGYGVELDGGEAQPVEATDTVAFPVVLPGEHTVEIVDVAPTCSVAGVNPRTVRITSSSTARINFRIACSTPPELGRLQVGVTTTGADLDPDGYTVLIDRADDRLLAIDGEVVFDSVPTGPQLVRLAGVAGNCTVRLNPDTVTVSAGETAQAAFQVTCWPPLAGRIAFSRQRDIFVQDADGTRLRRLTTGEGTDENGLPTEVDGQPAWSPDGRKLAFVRDFVVYVMDQDGFNTIRLTPDSLSVRQEHPKWSPDGRTVMFITDLTDESGTLHTINANGTALRQVSEESVLWASWAPNGRRIATVLAVFPFCCTAQYRLALMDADGSNLLELAAGLPPFGASAVEWSPDGVRLAIVATNIFVSDTLAGSLQEVVSGTTVLNSVGWSPDGLRLTFPMASLDGDSSGPVKIYTINRDGTGLAQLTGALPDPFEELKIDDSDPAWGQ